MKQIKEKIIKKFVDFGKRHRKLSVPVIAALAMVLTVYYVIRDMCDTLVRKKSRRRLVCILLAGLLFLQMGPLDIVSYLGISFGTKQEEAYAASDSVELKRESGSGKAFMYYNFNEVKNFVPGTTYAFLDGIYGPDDAVTMLGSGAVLKAKAENNNSLNYIRGWYGDSATVKVYVDVVTRGKGFDSCPMGGLYQMPNSGTPSEYRYFCYAGGARNAGPLYAYSYDTAALTYLDVSATLNEVGKKGSKNPADYTVKISHDGKTITLAPSSYTIQVPDPNSDQVNIIVEDGDGNKISTVFRCPMTIIYAGNADGVSNVPAMQTVWRGNSLTLSNTVPIRSGYTLLKWKDSLTGSVYSKGASITPTQDLRLFAQWKDTQAPAVDYQLVQVATRTDATEVKALVEKALTITDNEPVDECTVSMTVPSDIAQIRGDKTVTVTVTDKAGNKTIENCIVNVVALPVELRKPGFTESTTKLSATLYEPGSDTISETGFVWGVMNNPTVTLNNGKAKTSAPVTSPNSSISVTADNLTKGVIYYARAYAVSAGITYYSDEITFGLGLPDYGTFTIKNNGDNSFTVSRSGSGEGKQIVSYRTVNGSAVGGTHFTHEAKDLTFNSGETTKTFSITENTANTPYGSETATAYINADRTYQVELYRVKGGGSLGTAKTATRKMTAENNYKVDRTIYTTEKSKIQDVSNKWVTDHSGGERGDVIWRSDRQQNTNTNKDNFNCSWTLDESTYPGISTYIKKTAGSYLYRYAMKAHEQEDGREQAWMGTHKPGNAGTKTPCGGDYQANSIDLNDSVAGEALYTASFQVGQDSTAEKRFPATETRGDDNGEDTGNLGDTVRSYKVKDGVYHVDDTTKKRYIKIPISSTVYNYFGASGKGEDRWWVEGFTDYTMIYDDIEPQLVAVAPMAGGLYKVGDEFTVALIFDEIVDSDNSPNIEKVSLATSWGPAKYVGGVNTNVLYFTGTVGAGATNTLTVSSISTGAEYIKDMCNVNGTKTASTSKNTTASVDTAVPNLTVTSKGVANGAGTAVIKVNTDQNKTTAMKYVWSDSKTMPVKGWVEASSLELSTAKSSDGLTLGIRKKPGSGSSDGKWYLHVIGTYDTTGATAHTYAEVDFGTEADPVAGAAVPSLTVSVDNTNWATQRTIAISAKDGTELKYRKMGDSAWKPLGLNDTGITVEENGHYTFILTAGDQTVTQNVQVTKLDRKKPGVSVGALSSEDGKTVETAKNGVYTKITLPITYSDSDSGVTKVEYAWTGSTSTPTSWKPIFSNESAPAASGSQELTYAETGMSETTKYLHIKVTDKVGYTNTSTSAAYKMVAETKVNNTPPTISITGAPKKWTNDMATLIWQLGNYSGKNYIVTLPDGRTSVANKGNLLANQNGTYTVTVEDNDYGASNSASILVDKLDFTPPTVKVTGVPSGWKNTAQTICFSISDSQSGVGKGYYKYVESKDEIPTTGFTEFAGTGMSKSITVGGPINRYLYYKFYDEAGDDSVGREANKKEGFLGPIQIDTKKVAIGFQIDGTDAVSGKAYPDAPDITVKLSDSGISGGIKTVTYQVGTATQKVINHNYALETITDDTFTIPASEIPDGAVSITVNVTDHAGNTSEGTYSFEVYNDSVITISDIKSPNYDGSTVMAGTDFKVTVNGSGKTPVYRYKKKDTADSTYMNGFPKDAGTYTVKAGVAQDDTTHHRSAESTFNITILPKEIGLLWDNTAFTYNGTEQKPTVTATGLVEGEDLTVTVTGEKKDSCKKAGVETYTATAGILLGKFGTNAANYKLPEAKTTSFTIVPKPVKLAWTNTEFIYNGAEQKPTATVNVSTLIEGDTCKVMTVDGGQTDACAKTGVGSYTATAASLSNSNYKLPETGSETNFVIRQKLLTSEDIEVLTDSSDNSYPYNGSEITPKVTVRDKALTISQEAALLVQDTDYTIDGTAGATNYGTYSLSVHGTGNYTGDVELTWDITDPNDPFGTIVLEDNSWTKFLNNLTFGLLFNETKNVTITGEDGKGESGLKDIHYYVSEKELTTAEVSEVPENAWTKIASGGTFSIGPDQNVVIYAKITDNSGRTTYINSDGIVLDATAPVIIGVADGGKYCAEGSTEVTFTVEEPNLDKVAVSYLLNGAEKTEELTDKNGTYTLPAKGAITLTAVDKAGNGSSMSLTVSENHAYGEWVTKKQGTCIEAGLREHVCRLCGKVETEDIPASHVWEITGDGSIKYTLDKKNGCTEEGKESQHCSICSATQNERTLPATGHSFGEWKETVSECTGIVKTRVCEKCGMVETDNAAGEHAWESQATIDKEVTCTEDGSKSVHCSKCSVTKDVEIIPATGHKPGEVWLYQATEHWHTCDVCGMILDKAQHTESDWIIEKEASETEAGMKKKICTACGRELKWGVIPAGGSEVSGSVIKEVEVKEKAPVKEVSVEQDVSKLQETVLSEEERKAVLEEGTDIEIIVEVNRVASDDVPDRVQLKKIIEKAVEEIKNAASLCDEELSGEPGLVYVDLSMHKKITAIQKKTDPESGTVSTSTEETVEDVHEVKEAVTIILGIPEDIRYPKSEAYTRKFTVVRVHESGAGTEIEALPTLEKDGKLIFETDRFSVYAIIYQDVAACAGGNHTWDENYTVDKKSMCTEAGSKSIHCRYCSEVKDVQALPATGHTYSNWEVVKEATATADGEREKYCMSCGNIVKEKITASKEEKDKPDTGNNGQTTNNNQGTNVSMADKQETTAGRKSQAEKAPETGDESRPLLYALLAVLSSLGIGFLGKKKKKEKNV